MKSISLIVAEIYMITFYREIRTSTHSFSYVGHETEILQRFKDI